MHAILDTSLFIPIFIYQIFPSTIRLVRPAFVCVQTQTAGVGKWQVLDSCAALFPTQFAARHSRIKKPDPVAFEQLFILKFLSCSGEQSCML
jgi:hypothetical protein